VAENVRPCGVCGNPTEAHECDICSDPRRDPAVVCVVEDPATVAVVERSTDFRGQYHVLGGHLSPLDGIGPEALRIDTLVDRVRDGEVREIILATNPSMEGEATSTYLQQALAAFPAKVTRLARGLPVGGDLEYVDGVTLSHALTARQEVQCSLAACWPWPVAPPSACWWGCSPRSVTANTTVKTCSVPGHTGGWRR
jgi:recombination protein RecR